MAYEIGTATDATDLRTLIYAFATANGWTDTAGVLSQGSSYIRMNVLDAETLEIEGDTDGTFAAGACPQKAKVFIEPTVWPVTYRFFGFSAPEFFGAVLQYDVSRFQMIWAGSISKYGTWTGGNWFGASHGMATTEADLFYMTATRAGGTVNQGPVFETATAPGAPFWGTVNTETFGGGYRANRASFLHAEVDGSIWPGAGVEGVWPTFPGNVDPMHTRQPNVWNSQSVLLPMWLFFERGDVFDSPLGHLERMRELKIDNYNTADIITLGADKWMVFPWHKKDLTAPDGGLNPDNKINHSGTFGVAFEYDGP